MAEMRRIENQIGRKFNFRHEVSVADGRIDSVYRTVFFEFKNPNSRADKIGATLHSSGSKALVEQIKSRFHSFSQEGGFDLSSIVGIGLDGRHAIFVRFYYDQWHVESPAGVNVLCLKRIISYLVNANRAGTKAFEPRYLKVDFGSDAPIPSAFIGALYRAMQETEAPKVRAIFSEWKALFYIISGKDVVEQRRKLVTLVDQYGFKPSSDFDPAVLLFCVHTYFAIFMKLISSEILCYSHRTASPAKNLMAASSTDKFRREIADLEDGGVFRHFKVFNFLEGDIFSWYLAAWDDEIEERFRNLISKFSDYNPGTLSDNPLQNRDLLKELYLSIIPRSVRHDLGEYYTPDWVAELAIKRSRYSGDPNCRFLDPACGSGTFLVQAINTCLKWFEKNRHEYGYSEKDFADRLLKNVVGFDLNPLAVLASRTNYLIAIREFMPYLDEIHLPVYLADSVVTPTEYNDLFVGVGETIKVPCALMSPPFLYVPKEVAQSSRMVSIYANTLGHCLKVGLGEDGFVKECGDHGLPVSKMEVHKKLYNDLDLLQKNDQNGIWIKIIRNSFAPLFEGRFDFVVSNPPWVSWEYLPKTYREISEAIWRQYGLLGKLPIPKRQSSDKSKTDVSVLMLYVSIDKYLKSNGRLVFVLPRTLFQSEIAGWHFRKFCLDHTRNFRLEVVDDIDPTKPFREQAVNFSCIATFENNNATEFPIRWVRWLKKNEFDNSSQLAHVLPHVKRRRLEAVPVDRNWSQSPLFVGTPIAARTLRDIAGPSYYSDRAREGVNTRGCNGVYFVDAWMEIGRVFICNRVMDGRNAELEAYTQSIDTTYLYPLVKGREVSRWRVNRTSFILVPHSTTDPVPPVEFRRLDQTTRNYLFRFKEVLRSRKPFRNFNPGEGEWHGLYSVLPACFSKYKVVWREIASGIVAAVVSTDELPDKSRKPVVPDHKLFMIPCISLDEADFVCGFLNSKISDFFIRSYAISTSTSIHILDRIPIPKFKESNATHKEIAALSQMARQKVEEKCAVKDIERRIDEQVCLLLSLPEKLLDLIDHWKFSSEL